MRSETASALPRVTDACPPDLRRAIDAWRAGKIGGRELVEASYYIQLDILPQYEKQALPTPPEAVQRYRALSAEDRFGFNRSARDQMQRRYAAFFEEEERVISRNQSRLVTLRDLLAWAKAKPLSQSIVESIQAMLWTHEDGTEIAPPIGSR